MPKKTAKKRAAKSASKTTSRMYATAAGRTSAKGLKKGVKAGRRISDQDVAEIAAAVSRMMAVASGRAGAKYIGEEAKRRAGRTVSDQDRVFGEGVGFKKGGPAKKRAKGGKVKK